MNIFLIVLACLAALIGLAGAILPGLAGPPFSFAALIILLFTSADQHPLSFLIIMGLVCVIITVMDYIFPSLITNKMGGSKGGVWGCNIGLIVSIIGLPFGPTGILGVIFWPFAGAFIGELLMKKPAKPALKAAFGSFLGMLSSTLLKVVYAIYVIVICVKDIF